MPIPLEYVSIYAYSRTAALARLSLQCLFFVLLLLGFFFFSRHFAEVELNEQSSMSMKKYCILALEVMIFLEVFDETFVEMFVKCGDFWVQAESSVCVSLGRNRNTR